jgi:hypothetical protein
MSQLCSPVNRPPQSMFAPGLFCSEAMIVSQLSGLMIDKRISGISETRIEKTKRFQELVVNAESS